MPWLILLLALAGCAVPTVPEVPADADAGRATIVAVRPLVAAPDILALLGGRPAAAGAAQEFILRTAEGRIISVVQDRDAALHPGRSVSVIAGDRARLSAL